MWGRNKERMPVGVEGAGPLDLEMGDDPRDRYWPPGNPAEELAAQSEESAALLAKEAELYKDAGNGDDLDDLTISGEDLVRF